MIGVLSTKVKIALAVAALGGLVAAGAWVGSMSSRLDKAELAEQVAKERQDALQASLDASAELVRGMEERGREDEKRKTLRESAYVGAVTELDRLRIAARRAAGACGAGTPGARPPGLAASGVPGSWSVGAGLGRVSEECPAAYLGMARRLGDAREAGLSCEAEYAALRKTCAAP